MKISEQTSRILDSFAPFGSGIGNLITGCIILFSHTLLFPIGLIVTYFLCTCMHRGIWYYSRVALKTLFWSFISVLLALPLVFVFLPGIFEVLLIIFFFFILFIIPFSATNYYCKWEQRREQRMINQQWLDGHRGGSTPAYNPIPASVIIHQADAHCRFCDTPMTHSLICPKCGRKNP